MLTLRSAKLAAAFFSLFSRVGHAMGSSFFRRISILDLRISCFDSASLTWMCSHSSLNRLR